MQLVIMNFRDCSVHFIEMEESMDNEQIEEWVVDNTDFNLDEIQFMTSETPIQVFGNKINLVVSE
jgi:hypothetical protein